MSTKAQQLETIEEQEQHLTERAALEEALLNEEIDTGEEVESDFFTTPDVLPIRAVGRGGIVELDGGRYSSLLKVEGLDMRLMSQTEKNGLVRRFASLVNTLNAPFTFVSYSKPRNMKAYAAELDRKRAREHNRELRSQYWTEMDFLQRLHQDNSLTERNYYLALQATPADLKGSQALESEGANEDEDDNEEKRPGLWRTLVNRFRTVFMGKDTATIQAEASMRRALAGDVSGKAGAAAVPTAFAHHHQEARRGGEHGIPPMLADALRFRRQSLSDQLNNNRMLTRPLDDEETISLLGELLGSPYSSPGLDFKGRNVNPLYRIGGGDIKETPDYLKLTNHQGERSYVGCLYVTDFNKTVKLGALFDIVRFKDIEMLVALQVRPLSNQQAEAKLKNRQQILYAVQANDQSFAGDLNRSYKIESIRQLRDTLARGDARLFTVGLRVSIRAKTRRRMEADLRRVAQRFTEMGFPVATATRNQRRAYFSTLPLGHDWLGYEKLIADRTVHPNLTGENVACLLPNCIVDATSSGGIILGVNKADGSLVTFNRWPQVNPHTVVIATSGSGKTVGMEIELLREMLHDPKLGAYYIDPQGVLGNFARMVGGTMIDLGPKGQSVINPMDRYIINGKPEDIGERLTFLYPLLELMTRAELSASDRAAISRAVKRLYHHFEDGESVPTVLALSFANQPLYTPLQPYLHNYRDPQTGEWREGVVTKLNRIYARLREKYRVPSTGRVRGREGAAHPRRPVCYLADNRWYYTGEGETEEPLEGAKGQKSATGSKLQQPAEVWYPAPDWYNQLAREFEQAVQDEGVFDALDMTALHSAIRDAFVELKAGMPILSDLFPFLAAEGAINLVSNLEQYADPEVFGKMFNGYTNVALDRRFIAFNVRDLGEELLRPIRIFQTINYTWGQVRAIRQPRLMVVDEFGLLVQNFADVGNYVRDLFMRGRAFYLSMTVIVQNITSLLDYQSARQCIENAERVILMRQQKTALHRLKGHFELTDGQLYQLLGAEPGAALEQIDGRWLYVQYTAAPDHLAQFDTRPQEATALLKHPEEEEDDYEEEKKVDAP